MDIDVPAQSWVTDPPVMDVKLANGGRRTAVVTRMVLELLWAKRFSVLDDLLPFIDTSGPLKLDPSATYEVRLPDPEDAADTRITVVVSHVIVPGDADRFEVRLHSNFSHSKTSVYSQPSATSVYLLRLHLSYNGNDQLSSRVVGVACPGNVLFVPTPQELSEKVRSFWDKVAEIRQAVSQEMTSSNQRPPDWANRPPRSRQDLPRTVRVLDRVNDRFWHPERAVERYLDEAETCCREIAGGLSPDMPDGLDEAITWAEETIAAIPELRRQLGGGSRRP